MAAIDGGALICLGEGREAVGARLRGAYGPEARLAEENDPPMAVQQLEPLTPALVREPEAAAVTVAEVRQITSLPPQGAQRKKNRGMGGGRGNGTRPRRRGRFLFLPLLVRLQHLTLPPLRVLPIRHQEPAKFEAKGEAALGLSGRAFSPLEPYTGASTALRFLQIHQELNRKTSTRKETIVDENAPAKCRSEAPASQIPSSPSESTLLEQDRDVEAPSWKWTEAREPDAAGLFSVEQRSEEDDQSTIDRSAYGGTPNAGGLRRDHYRSLNSYGRRR